MHSFNSFQQQTHSQSQFDLEEDTAMDSHTANGMEGYNYLTATNNYIPFDFADLQNTTFDSYVDPYSHMMTRTGSDQSIGHSGLMSTILSDSTGSGTTTSSRVGSPYSSHTQMAPAQDSYLQNYFTTGPQIINQDGFIPVTDMAYSDGDIKCMGSYSMGVDPSMLLDSTESLFEQSYHGPYGYAQLPKSTYTASPALSPSPAPSNRSYMHNAASVSSLSAPSPRTSISGVEDNVEKDRCTHPDCGKVFKDLKAHMLTHQEQRPEKCPIISCDWNIKGFSRKYDKNRHTLTHYKGTMICPFCSGCGTPTEKSFNRADVFKRHLIKVHGVEQSPPNSRKRSPTNSGRRVPNFSQDAIGKCSTCSKKFGSAQEFYEHLDDCVLAVVQQLDDSEHINEKNLGIADGEATNQDGLGPDIDNQEDGPQYFEDDGEDYDAETVGQEYDDDEEEDEYNERPMKGATRIIKNRPIIGGNVSKTRTARKNTMTWSKLGVSCVPRGRKKRKDYPPSWGMPADKMKMKKRALFVFDGSRRLLKDDMMLRQEYEVRVPLDDEGKHYVTDLDVETIKRADAFHNATQEEKGPWIPAQDFPADLWSN